MELLRQRYMSYKNVQLPIIVQQDEDGYYFIECPLFEACYTQGDTLDEAMKNIREVIEMCLEEEENKEILKDYRPQGMSLHTITI